MTRAGPDAEFEREVVGLLPPVRLRLLDIQPVERGLDFLTLVDLEVLLSSSEVAAFQRPAKLSDAMR